MIRKVAIPVLALVMSVNAKERYGEQGEQKWYQKEVEKINKNAQFIADKQFISTLTIPE